MLDMNASSNRSVIGLVAVTSVLQTIHTLHCSHPRVYAWVNGLSVELSVMSLYFMVSNQ